MTAVFSAKAIGMLISLWLICPLAFAQEKMRTLLNLSLSELTSIKISSATKRPQAIKDVPATVYVFTEQDFSRYGFRDIKDVLKYIPGVEYGYAHSWLQGGQRGFSNTWSQTKFLIDGRDANLKTSNGPYFQHQYPLYSIKRIEVIQGPASSLYGADAFVGIINLVTKDSDNSAAESLVSLNVGSGDDDLESQQLNYSWIEKSENWGVAAHISVLNLKDPNYSDYVLSNDFSELNQSLRSSLMAADNPYRDDNRGYTGAIKWKYRLSNKIKLEAGIDHRSSRDGGGIENPELIFNNFKDTEDQTRAFFSYMNQWTKADKVTVDYQHERERSIYDFNLRDPATGIPPPLLQFSQEWSRMDEISVQYDKVILDWDNYLVFGVDHMELKLARPKFELSQFESVVPFLDHRLESIYIQDQQVFLDGKAQLTLGGRHDHSDLYGHVNTVRGGLQYRFNSQYSVKLLYGEAFRAPTPFEFSSNANLNPAEIESTELALDVIFSENLVVQFSIYHSRGTNIIREDRQLNDGIARNIGTKKVDGFEAFMRWELGDYQGFTWLNYLEETDDVDVSDYKYGFGISRRLNQWWELSAVGKYTDTINTEAFDVGQVRHLVTVPKYKTMDLILRGHRLPFLVSQGEFDIAFSIYNLFDTKNLYPNVRGPDPIQFLAEGRSAYLKASYAY